MTIHTAKEYITVKEFLQQLHGRLSKNTAYEQVAAGTIPSVRIGRRILTPGNALDRMLAAQGDHNQEPRLAGGDQ